jgi:glycosyltransferase involved in cell wall biosynthesis
MIYFLPIEPLEARYSAQMLKWVSDDLENLVGAKRFAVLLPSAPNRSIAHGQFLDDYASTQFKAWQLAMVSYLFQSGKVHTGDVFLLGDVWFPGIEAVRMMADLAGVGVKIVGWHYAGTFDPADYYSRSLGPWARRFEEMLCEHVLDAVCVGSRSHADLLRSNLKVAVHPFGLSWKPQTLIEHRDEPRENIVVFPHRIAPEKNVQAFLRCARKFKGKGWRFVISTPMDEAQRQAALLLARETVEVVAHNKADYYALLRRSKIVYSAAKQETFGYAINEAIACGCGVVAPNRLSYPEVLEHDQKFLYGEDDQDGVALLAQRMANHVPVPFSYTDKYSNSTVRFLRAILPVL